MSPRPLAALVLAGLALGGCGGDSGPTTASYARDVNAICRQAATRLAADRRALAAAQQRSDANSVYAELARITADAAKAATGFVDRIDAVEPPAKDRDALQAWVALQRRRELTATTLADAYRRRDSVQIATLAERVDRADAQIRATAVRYELTDCAAGV